MLKTGLNIQKKNNSSTSQVPQKRLSAFGDASDDDEDDTAPAMPVRGPRFFAVPQSALRKVTLDEDDIAYDYDGVYDSMKVHERRAAEVKEQDKRERKPKYMQDLFNMAEVRKRDRLQAEDIKLQREREQEGDLFADKEQFVTSAYRAQQQALLDKERADEEAEQELRRQAGGLTAFSEGILANGRRKQEAAVQASLHAERKADASKTNQSTKVLTEAEKARIAEAQLGHKVAVNDNNEIVDHRELLAAGLYKAPKPYAPTTEAHTAQRQSSTPRTSEKEREQRRAQLARHERAMAEQLQEARSQENADRARKQAVVEEQAKRTKTDADISSAKERYLARKRAKTENQSNS
jgi:hypothetical protein